MATEAKDAAVEKAAASDTVEITFEDVIGGEIGGAVVAIKAYEHPITRCGVRQDTSVKLGRLTRALRDLGKEYVEEHNALLDRYGERKDPEKPDTAVVKKDSPHRAAFNLALRDLRETKVQVDAKLRIRLSELMVRDENGELVEMDCGRIGDLGPLLIEDVGAAAPEAELGRPRRRSRGGGKR